MDAVRIGDEQIIVTMSVSDAIEVVSALNRARGSRAIVLANRLHTASCDYPPAEARAAIIRAQEDTALWKMAAQDLRRDKELFRHDRLIRNYPAISRQEARDRDLTGDCVQTIYDADGGMWYCHNRENVRWRA